MLSVSNKGISDYIEAYVDIMCGTLPQISLTPQETAVKNTGPFLRYITDQMHERVPGSVVIWYDSVLKNGSLNWQNELNDDNRQVMVLRNYRGADQVCEMYSVDIVQLMPSASFCPPIRMFFDACDGIFTNYNWTEKSLEWMKSYSAAQGRFADIYVGVDVFARGKVVGGKFETNKVSEVLENNFNI